MNQPDGVARFWRFPIEEPAAAKNIVTAAVQLLNLHRTPTLQRRKASCAGFSLAPDDGFNKARIEQKLMGFCCAQKWTHFPIRRSRLIAGSRPLAAFQQAL